VTPSDGEPDRSQLRSREFVHALDRHQLVGSMGRVGAGGDNAAMESFFSLLQKNVLSRG
jgi:putative transposase